jgi:hypothetical protein
MPTERTDTKVQTERLDTEVQAQVDKLLNKVVHDQAGGLLFPRSKQLMSSCRSVAIHRRVCSRQVTLEVTAP